jgi:hypothetical protein
MPEPIFADGFIVKKPEGAPDFVKANVSIKVSDFAQFVKDHQKDGWLNIQILESKKGSYYGKLNNYEPKDEKEEDLPF